MYSNRSFFPTRGLQLCVTAEGFVWNLETTFSNLWYMRLLYIYTCCRIMFINSIYLINYHAIDTNHGPNNTPPKFKSSPLKTGWLEERSFPFEKNRYFFVWDVLCTYGSDGLCFPIGDFPNNIRAFSAIDAVPHNSCGQRRGHCLNDPLLDIGRYIQVPRQLAHMTKWRICRKWGLSSWHFLTRGCCDLEWWIGTQLVPLTSRVRKVYVYSMLAF